MKELDVSNYALEVLSDSTPPFSYKELDVSNYDLEVLSDIVITFSYKELDVSSLFVEVLHPFIDITPPASDAYFFAGNILENTTPIVRQVLAYNQAKLLMVGEASSDTYGTFLLGTSESVECFLLCKDDNLGTSYNNIVVASIDPILVSTYGMSSSNPGKSAYDIKIKNSAATYNGVYWIQPTGYVSPVQVYCDMTTQGGGWTMCARWDRDFPTGWIPCLPSGAMRNNINVTDMIYTNTLGATQTSTINVIPIIAAGATMFMHVSIDLYGAMWKYVYFSEIYQVISDNPNNIFNTSFDTNYVSGGGVAGASVQGSFILKNRWFDYNMDIITTAANGTFLGYYLSGSEGDAMFTNGGRPGAVYSAFNGSDMRDTPYPTVMWGFYGKDGSVTDYASGRALVGTNIRNTSEYKPNCRFNFMFIR